MVIVSSTCHCDGSTNPNGEDFGVVGSKKRVLIVNEEGKNVKAMPCRASR
jgi:hypothetical protein